MDGEKGRRVVSIGDLHGDWERATGLLTSLGVLEDGHWAGGDAILVSTGDMVDRGDHGKRIWELMFQLQDEATAMGGKVILLLGNHELMCIQNDLRYTTQADLDAYGGRAAFMEAWSPTGEMGKMLRTRTRVIAKVSDVVYVHAGILPQILMKYAPNTTGKEAINEMNKQIYQILDGDWKQLKADGSELLKAHGPFWTRTLSQAKEASMCPLLEGTLELLGARRMVVGHTPQEDGEVRPRCGGRLLMADTLMSIAYTGNAEESAHHEAGVEFFGDSSHISAVYAKRSDEERCKDLSGYLAEERESAAAAEAKKVDGEL